MCFAQVLQEYLDKYKSLCGGVHKPFCGMSNFFLSHAWSYKVRGHTRLGGGGGSSSSIAGSRYWQ